MAPGPLQTGLAALGLGMGLRAEKEQTRAHQRAQAMNTMKSLVPDDKEYLDKISAYDLPDLIGERVKHMTLRAEEDRRILNEHRIAQTGLQQAQADAKIQETLRAEDNYRIINAQREAQTRQANAAAAVSEDKLEELNNPEMKALKIKEIENKIAYNEHLMENMVDKRTAEQKNYETYKIVKNEAVEALKEYRDNPTEQNRIKVELAKQKVETWGEKVGGEGFVFNVFEYYAAEYGEILEGVEKPKSKDAYMSLEEIVERDKLGIRHRLESALYEGKFWLEGNGMTPQKANKPESISSKEDETIKDMQETTSNADISLRGT